MRKLKTLSILLAAFVGLASCSDDANTDYQPATPTADGSVRAFFKDTTSAIVLTPEEDPEFTVTVKRKVAAEAATVPIVVNYVDTTAIHIPSSVSFAAGETEKQVTIDCTGLTVKRQYGFSFSIADEAADHYTVNDEGSSRFEGSIIISQWVKIKENVKFYYSGASGMPVTYSDLYQLDGVNKFYLTDFLGSGANLNFTVGGDSFKLADGSSSASNLPTGEGELVPAASNVYTEVYDTYSLYTFYLGTNDAGEDVWNWSVGDFAYDAFYWYGGSSYSYISFDDNYIYMSAYVDTNYSLYGVWQ